MQPKYTPVETKDDDDIYDNASRDEELEYREEPGVVYDNVRTSTSAHQIPKSMSMVGSARDYQPVVNCDTSDCEHDPTRRCFDQSD